MKRSLLCLLGAAALILAACGDDTNETPDAKVTLDGLIQLDGPGQLDGGVDLQPDGQVVLPDQGTDQGTQPECLLSEIGKPCKTDPNNPQGFKVPCAEGYTCLIVTSGQPDGDDGVCTCNCDPDKPETPLVNEDTCPQGTISSECGVIDLVSGTKQGFCFKYCDPKLGGNDCGSPLACDPRSGPPVGIWDKAICLFPGCKADTDCPVVTNTICDTTNDTCPTGQKCISYLGGTEGRCAAPGKCDLVSGLCDKKPAALSTATAKVGAPCQDDRDCGEAMSCMMEFDAAQYLKAGGETCTDDEDCCSGKCTGGKCAAGYCMTTTRNGYCVISGCAFANTLTIKTCPAEAACNKLFTGGICQKKCDLETASDCRGNPGDLYGDYECRAWNNLALASGAFVSDPVCDFGSIMTCDLLKLAKLDCSVVGLQGNPTDMSCRDLAGNKKTDPNDAFGFCFDNTSSGTQFRDPMPTP